MQACLDQAAYQVDGIELEPNCRDTLAARNRTVMIADFLTVDRHRQHERIVMNSPFTRGAYHRHVANAKVRLSPHGLLFATFPNNNCAKLVSLGALTVRVFLVDRPRRAGPTWLPGWCGSKENAPSTAPVDLAGNNGYPHRMPKVVFVMLDGVRPDAIRISNTPTLDRLVAQGSSTFSAQSVMPSITLPCHTSIFHSVPPTRHGITSNRWTPMARPLPGLIEVLAAAGKKSAFFYNWEQLRDVSQPGHLSFSYARNSCGDEDGDDDLAREAADRIPREGWDFVFLYFGTVDTTGHRHGWMSPQYLAQLEHVDSLLGGVLDTISEEYSIIVHADHGGHERNHGTDCPEDMTVPWIAAGNQIKASHAIQVPVSIMDTAPTVAHLLGLAPHPDWEGKVIEEIVV